jgi:hypothetical protein
MRRAPIEQRHFGIGIVPADQQDQGVQAHEHTGQVRKAKTAKSGDENDDPEHRRRDFQPPREPVPRLPAGPDQLNRKPNEQRQRQPASAGARSHREPV